MKTRFLAVLLITSFVFVGPNKNYACVNDPPDVSITAPSDGDTFKEGDNVTIEAYAFDQDGEVTKVEFYQGTTKLGEDTDGPPWSHIWYNIPAGSCYSLTAKAFDNDGATTTSDSVGITVTDIWYVDVDAMNVNGQSWGWAFHSLQDALKWANTGDEIRVAEGIYRPDEDKDNPNGTGDRGATFQLINGVTVYGGFAGYTPTPPPPPAPPQPPAPDPDTRDIELYLTVLSGDLNGDDDGFTNNSDNSYHVIAGANDATVDGFTITDGGAGVCFAGCTGTTVSNCIISGNRDGVLCYPSSSPLIKNNNIHSNTDNGICSIMATATVKNNCIYDNGVGVLHIGDTNESIVNNTVVRNTLYGIHSNGSQAPTVANCILWDNGDDLYGGSATYSCIKDGDYGSGGYVEVGYWRMDDDAANTTVLDSSGNANNGTVQQNTSALTTSGKIGSALSFNGASDYVNCGDPANGIFDFGTSEDFSLAAWIKTSGTSMHIISKGLPSEISKSYWLYVNDSGKLNAGISDGSAPRINFSGSTTINNDSWHHVAATFDRDGNLTLCVDGDSDGQTSISSENNDLSNSSNLLIGRNSGSGSEYFNGDIDNVSVHGKALSSAEVDALYRCAYYCQYFVDADGSDFHLKTYSPCIDTGDPVSAYFNEPNGGGGRINMGAYGNTTEAALASANSDGDGLPDDWEQEFLGGTSEGNADDNEDSGTGDGLTNIQEYQLGTRADLSDTDGDGMSDGWEYDNKLDPLDSSDADGDLDGDGKTNLKEYLSGSDPSSSDITRVPTDANTIQAAIDASTHDWDVVEIEPNTYSGAGNCDLDFGGKKITVRSTDPLDPDVVVATIINCNGTESDPNRAFYFHNSEGSESVVSGLKIINGYGQQSGSDYIGGAILCNSSSPTIKNCIFSGSSATIGGAVYNISSSPTFENCSFVGNYVSAYGAGMYNQASSPTLTNCVFLDNVADSNDGGAVYNDSSSDPSLTNCTLVDNTAENGDGGGIFNKSGSTPILSNCILWGNSDAGEIYFSEDFEDGDCSSGDFGDLCYTDWTVVDEGTIDTPSSWSVASGILKQTSNIYDASTGIEKLGTYAYYESGGSWTDYKVSSLVYSGDDDAIGVMFRYQDPDNYYRFSWDRERGYRRLVKCLSGSFTLLVEDQVQYTQSRWYKLEIIIEGNDIRTFVDGQLVLSAVDGSLSSGTIALYSWGNTGAQFDKLIVSHPSRTGEGEYAQIYGGNPDVMFSCVQDSNPDDLYNPFGGDDQHNIDDNPEFRRWVSNFSLISYWKFDEGCGTTAYDSAGENEGNVNDATWTTGQVGGALSFDGVDDYVIIEDHGSLEGMSELTITMWVKPDTLADYDCLIHKGVWGDGFVAHTGSSGDIWWGVSTSDRIKGNSILSTGTWQFIALYFKGGDKWRIYKDGFSSVASVNAIATSIPTSGAIDIGIGGGGGVSYFHGTIDDVRIYSEALSSEEIETLYLLGLNELEKDLQISFNSPCIDSGYDNSVDPNVSKDIVGTARILDGNNDGTAVVDLGAYELDCDYWWSLGKISQWSFDEGSGLDAYDSVGDNDGIIHNAAWTTGKYGSALYLDGTDDYVYVGENSSLAHISEEFTVTFWADPSATHEIDTESTSGTSGISGQKYAIGPAHGDSHWGSGHAGAGVSIGTNGISVYEHASSYLPAVLVWEGTLSGFKHIAVVYQNNNRPRLYVDGELQKIGLESSKIVHVMPRHVGQSGYGDFKGVIDELIIYDRALSSNEIEALAGNRAPVLSSIGGKVVVEDDLLSFSISATDPDGDTLTYSAQSLPSGAKFKGNTFTWVPSVGQEGSYNVKFTTSDGALEDTETITIDVVAEQLAAFWKLDEESGSTAYDSAGDNDGTVNGATWATGKIKGALSFDGDADYVALTDMNDAYYSISFWAKFTDTGAWERIVDFGESGGSSYQIVVGRFHNSSRLFYRNGSNDVSSDYDYIINDEWHHYTVVQVIEGSNNRVIFYRDGVQYGKAKTSTETPTAHSRTYCYIGKSNWNNDDFTGYIDELRVYERSLSDVEVERLAANQHYPVLTSIGNKSVDVNDLLSFSIDANDLDGTDITYSAENLPTGAEFKNYTFSWIPTAGQEGSYDVNFIADDGEFADIETVTITVNSASSGPQGVTDPVSGALGNDLNLQVDPFTGSVRYSVPIVVPPGRQGSEPSISLKYTGGGNGWCGVGWSLGIGVIQRNTRYGVPVKRSGTTFLSEYDDDKGFVVSFGAINSHLVDVGSDVYRAQTDQAFLKYEFDRTNNKWIVTDKSGNKFYFGESSSARMEHSEFTASQGKNTFLWALEKIQDISGNLTWLSYSKDEAQLYLQDIRYNGHSADSGLDEKSEATHKVEFTLEDRPDDMVSYATGYRVETNKRLKEITVKVSGQHVRRYRLSYDVSASSRRSLLGKVTLFGTDNTTTLSPLVFEYQTNPFEFGPVQDWGPLDNQGYNGDNADGRKWNSPSATDSGGDTVVELLDINGDGLPDRVMRKKGSPYSVYKVQLNTGEGFEKDINGDYITRDWGPVKTQGNETDAAWGSVQAMDDSGRDAHVMPFDIDGDALSDRVMRNDVTNFASPENVFKYQSNTGSGFETPTKSWTNIDNQGQNTDKGWNSPQGGDTSGTQVTMCDINGDGLPDRVMRKVSSPYNVFKVQLNTGNGSFENSLDWNPLDAQGDTSSKWNSPIATENSDTLVTLMDINGDALPDRVMRKKTSPYTKFKVQFNTGYGFEEDVSDNAVVYDWGPIYTQGHDTDAAWGSITAADSDGSHVLLFDISADGLPDRVMRNDVTNFASPENVFKVQLNVGTGFESVTRNWKNIDNQGENTNKGWNSPQSGDADGSRVVLCDINGDGLADRVMRKKSGNYAAPWNVFKVQLNRGPLPDLLKKVTGSLGGSVEVTYTPSTRYDNTDHEGRSLLPYPLQTASAITVNDGLGTYSTTTYEYSRGYFDTDERGFKGFGRVVATGPLGTKSITYFHQGGGFDDSENGEYQDANSVAKEGIPYRVEVYGSDSNLYSVTVNKVEETEVQSDKGWYFAYVSQTTKLDYAGLDFDPALKNYTSDYRAKVRQSEYFTTTGNIKKSIDLGEVSLGATESSIASNIENHTYSSNIDPNDDLYIHTAYKDFTGINADILNKIESIKTTSDSAENNRLKEIIFTYDSKGRALTEKTWLDKDKDGDVNDYTVTSEYGYDIYGNRDYSKNKAGIDVNTVFDSTYHMFPVQETTGASFVTEAAYDANSGLPIWTKDVMGIKTETYYDEFYRPTDIYVATEPNGQAALWVTRIEYNLGGTVDEQTSKNFVRQRFNGYEAFFYSDGLGRGVQTRTKAEEGAENEFRVVDKAYDVRGNDSFVTTPFFSEGYSFTVWDVNRPGVLTEYDEVGRAYRISPTHDDENSPLGPSTTQYADGSDPWAQVSTDPEGKITKSYLDASGRVIKLIEVVGAVGGSDDIETEYAYDRLGRLIKTIDDSNNVIEAEYDSLGRKIRTDDPDMGEWYYKYDDADRMIEQIDARDNSIKLDYNDVELGRLTKKEVYDSNSQKTKTITYAYDSGETGYTVYKGLLFKVEVKDGQDSVETWTKTGYDTRGRAIKTTRYISEPNDTYTTETSYDDADRVTDISYPGDMATIHYDYGSAGELLKVRSTSGTGANETFYEPNGFDELGRLKGIDYGNGVETKYEYYQYSKRLYRMHTYKDSTNLQYLTYTYDRASNIKSITDSIYAGSSSNGLQNIQYDDMYRLTSLYSVAKDKTITYSYNALGNMTYNGELLSGNNYTYMGGGSTKPHAVTNANGKNYSYDECGNMTARGSQTLTYDEENRLIRVEDSGAGLDISFGYGEAGQRLWKKDNNTSQVIQVWIGDIYEEKYDSGRSKTLILCHVHAGDKLIATFEPESTWACIIKNNRYLAAIYGTGGKSYAVLFRGGRTPISLLCIGILVGFAFGVYYNRRRLQVKYGLASTLIANTFYKRDPWRQMILLATMASVIVAVTPGIAQATPPTYDPVFYYYHTDHLNSSQVMTDRYGVMVQQYGYKCYGDEQYKNNTSAFSVSNRFTGQILDEDTGLYYFGARYYDPQLARFVQADSIVPEELNSQALNRYSYCINNPLKFTDPTGQFFSAIFAAIKAIAAWLSSAAVVKAAIIGASIGAGMAALTGGDVLKGAISGAIGGMFGVGGNLVMAAAGGSVGALVTGGDPMMGAISAGISAGVGVCFRESPLPGVFGDAKNEYLAALLFSTGRGALSGGVTAEIFGGNFGQGAAYGVMGAAAGYIVHTHIQDFMRAIRAVGKFLIGNIESWLGPQSAIIRSAMDVKQDIIDLGLSEGIDSQINDNKYGHAMHMSHLQEEFGILGTPFLFVGGLLYEAVHVFFPGHLPGEQASYQLTSGGLFDGQHPVNWLYDTPGDIAANVFGQATGILSTVGIGNPHELNKATLMIPGPDYRGGPKTWKKLARPGYVYPPP